MGGKIKLGRKGAAGRKWYAKYLPFVAKSQEMQLEWLVDKLSRLRNSVDKEKTGLLSCEELKPYISLLLDGNPGGKELGVTVVAGDVLGALLSNVKGSDIHLMVECAEIYDVPRLFSLMHKITKEQAVLAMKKVPPLYEKKPLLVVDRVFHAIKEKSTELLENAAVEIMASDGVPTDFVANYERFQGLMMDEQILSTLYPKANQGDGVK
ncbi:MAG: hypothetical protein KAS94_04885 [Desulfobulbaceae bacterium]|nr:hypothetical protein [Desulfobulbaceae bacterium]